MPRHKPAASTGTDQMERAPSRAVARTAASTPRRAVGTPLSAGIAFARGRLVVDGVRLVLLPSWSTGRAGLLLQVAQRLRGTSGLHKLTQAARQQLSMQLRGLLQWRDRGRASLVQTRVHAACFALLQELGTSLRAPSERALAKQVRAALVQAADVEPHAALRMHMADALAAPAAPDVFVPRAPFQGKRRISFRPDAAAQPDAASRAALDRAVDAWQAALRDADLRAPAPRAAGFFRGGDDVSPVRLLADGAGLAVSLDARLSGADPDVIAMTVLFEGTRALLVQRHPDAPAQETRIQALALTARWVRDNVEFADIADLLLQRFALVHRFPPGLGFAAADKALAVDPQHPLSPAVTSALERAIEFSFLEVNPRRSSSHFRRYVGSALELLQRSDTAVARTTWDAIATGRVTVDELSDLNGPDFARLRRDFAKDGVHVRKRLDGAIDARSMRAITTDIAGYMWDDRVYVAANQSPNDLARALVHEVNHVLNASEEHYRGDRQTLLEEYRAFYAESLFAGEEMTPARCKKLKQRVIRDYGLDGVNTDDVPDVPPGIL